MKHMNRIRRARKGFSLIEVMVALTLLSLIMMSLAKLALYASIRGRGNDLYSKRAAALQREVNKFEAMPFTNLAAFSTSDKTFTVGDFTYTRKLTITAASSTRYTITVQIVPSNTSVSSDQAVVDRTSPPTSTPLCSGC